MNLTRAIARRERVEDALGTIGLLIVFAIFVEVVAFCVAGKIGSRTALNVSAAAGVVTIFVAIPACCVATKLNRLRDNLIVMEIKHRLDAPLMTLFEIEHAGQVYTFAKFAAWRDTYISKIEEDSFSLPVNTWIRAAKEAELPGAYLYRQRHPQHAILVDAVMCTAINTD